VLSALALAFGLAMDATAVCAARALSAKSRRELLILPLLFGLFQAGMAALGWAGGAVARPYIEAWDHWVAGGVLVLIGLHMFVEAWGADGDTEVKPGTPLLYLGLAIATSIDAAAAGLTLPLLPLSPPLALVAIGLVTAVCCAVGYGVATAIGDKLGRRLDIAGGLVLVGIGIDILIRQP
jgi:putative Mn2+ efflux pump MntP